MCVREWREEETKIYDPQEKLSTIYIYIYIYLTQGTPADSTIVYYMLLRRLKFCSKRKNQFYSSAIF